MKELTDLIQNNQVMTLLLGGSALTGILYYLKSLPDKLWNFMIWRFTSHVSITNDDAIFKVLSDWLSHQEFCKKARHLRCDSNIDDHTQMTSIKLCPGLGGMYFWYKGRPVLLNRNNPGGNSDQRGKPIEQITLRTVGSPQLLHDLMSAVGAFADRSTDFVDVHGFNYHWYKVARKAKRSLDTVILPSDQKDRITHDIQAFLSAKDWYLSMGIPYRRGIMFYGPPGTGKTSLALALAGVFDMRIHALTLGSVKDDESLLAAVTSLPEKSLLLIEDIDAAVTKREDSDDEQEGNITLGGLLNAIDGVFSRDGRLLIMTTNHPDKLDPALTRPGRVDLQEEISLLQSPEVALMCSQFLGEKGVKFAQQISEPIAASKLQNLLIQEKNKK